MSESMGGVCLAAVDLEEGGGMMGWWMGGGHPKVRTSRTCNGHGARVFCPCV
jgi:hypothetical protein